MSQHQTTGFCYSVIQTIIILMKMIVSKMLIYSREGRREKRDVSCHLLENRKASSEILIKSSLEPAGSSQTPLQSEHYVPPPQSQC